MGNRTGIGAGTRNGTGNRDGDRHHDWERDRGWDRDREQRKKSEPRPQATLQEFVFVSYADTTTRNHNQTPHSETDHRYLSVNIFSSIQNLLQDG